MMKRKKEVKIFNNGSLYSISTNGRFRYNFYTYILKKKIIKTIKNH